MFGANHALPPAIPVSKTTVFNPSQAAYMAAVKPAGPAPMINVSHFWIFSLITKTLNKNIALYRKSFLN
jgi:hypothetical protein